MHSTHFIYGYMASDIWLRTILIVRKETRCRHIGYSLWLTAGVLLYAPSHRQDSTYHGLCYTSRGALAETRNSSMGPPHEGTIRRPIAPWANALTTELHLAPGQCSGFTSYPLCFNNLLLELVPRCEPGIYHLYGQWFTHCTMECCILGVVIVVVVFTFLQSDDSLAAAMLA